MLLVIGFHAWFKAPANMVGLAAVVLAAVESRLPLLASSTDWVLVGIAVELLVAIPVAYLSYQLTERPFMRQRLRAH